MLRSALLWFCSAFTQFPVWVWFCLSMVPVFLLLSIHSNYFQLLIKSVCLRQKRGGESSSEGVVNLSETSSSYSTTDEYDVFLSFRGPDTRQGFTDVLYETMKKGGIRVFRDDDEVSSGQPLMKILHAIRTSQICVPIFSQTFAASSWCLREVERMVDLNKDVMPIFFDVKPDDLKLKTGAYCNHLKKHKSKYGKEKVKMWEEALKSVPRIKGKELLNARYTEFCKQFVDEVLSKLKPRKRLYTHHHLVGVDSKIESVMKLMDVQSHGIRYIGIHGMGGLGKTTLAKAIFDDLRSNFDCSCFLADVRESALRDNTLQDLQKQLQQGLDPEFARGCNSLRDIEERFQKKRVLVVLDDIDKWEQIEKLAGHSSWFGSGSRIIITTRNIDVLKKNGRLDQNEVLSFEISPLNNDQAFELFQWHAFRKEKPPSSMEAISRKIVRRAGGVPLAIKVIGSRLCNCKNEAVWRDVLKRLRKVPLGEVKEALKISYDALEHEEKQIFLDIACVGAMVDKQKAVFLWDASEFFPNLSLEVLCSMSLVKVVDDDKLWMHDLLKDLGNDIVREESVKDPGKRSRVWDNEEATEVLLRKEGKEMVETLCISKPLEVCLTHEHLASFQELRFLQLVGSYIECDFRNLLPKLGWFQWHLCPPILNTTNLYMKNLVVLDLSFSFISESWGGWTLIQILNNLKSLDLSNCHNLTRTPDFSEINRLERLKLRHCSNLHEIHGSIGKLQRLKHLDLRNCYSLDGLPDEIGCLVNLEELVVSCPSWRGKSKCIFNLPSSIGHLESLLVLQLEYLDIVDIPGSIGGLAKLRKLSLDHCYWIKELPESLGNLGLLRELNLSDCRGITELPNSIGGLVKLESLDLSGLSSLEILPESFGQLQELKVLFLTSSRLRKLPVFFGFLKKLEKIYYGGGITNPVLKEVPMEIGSLSCMRQLTLFNFSISMLPSAISQLKLLEELDLRENHQLQELPDLPLSLIKLRVSSKSLHKFPDLSRLVNLTELMLLGIDDYRWPQQQSSSMFEGIEKLTKLKSLRMGFASAAALQFDMGSLTWLEELSLDGPFGLCLQPAGASSLEVRVDLKLPDLSRLKNLSSLTFYDCFIKAGLGSAGFGIQRFGNVNFLYLASCGIELIEQTYLFKNLTTLYISDCGSFKTLPDLSSEMKNLTRLGVWSCEWVVEIPGLGNLISLTSLYIDDCDSLKNLENISKLVNLCDLSLSNCPKLRTIEGTEKLNLLRLVIDGCKSLRKVGELKKRSVEGRINGLEFENFR